ncbi:methionine ABC transporter ATP-binding protein [Paeniglutamicibacter cryotolerans]|uniref:D-methionine transport system ATP-binding protein n=1 Tax=Paeniglutamicibacter cryotolerans TaxID=670079 RepID=A0A839QJC2_9MICC|nr:ATP-binding cassette domain-containing protein [Paeniglutamicibacter cryotolerans]MBB2995703.1 D-methionine transport system ATP-binding protein [Paeniglutamicibacter cryotolerans]
MTSSPLAPARGSVRFENITKSYAAKGAATGVLALDDVSLDLPPGKITGVIGRSGAGKSTLLRTVNLLERPSSGRILLDGQDIAAVTGNQLREVRRRIGMIFQHFSLMSSKTVWENVRLPLRMAGVPDAEADQRVAELLELVGLDHRADAYPAQLSGGQKQRVGIARALVQDPEILLCDEATSALDPETTRSILELLQRINRERGVTILLITHEMGVIQEICDLVAVIDGGKVVEHGPVWQVFSSPEHPTTLSLLESFRRSSLPEITRALSGVAPAGAPDKRETQLVLRFDGTRPVDVSALVNQLQDQTGTPVRMLASSITPVQGHPQGYVVVSLGGGLGHDSLIERARSIASEVEILQTV